MMLYNKLTADQVVQWMCFKHRRMLGILLDDWKKSETTGKEPA